MALGVLLVLFFAFLPLLLLTKSRRPNERLPPGSMGIPFIGQSLGLLRAMRANTAEQWLADRIKRYGPISKLSLFGNPTIFLTGPAANKFTFTNEALVLQQPRSIPRIMGPRNMLELTGEDHRRVRGAVVQFLKLEVLKNYVGKIDGVVRHHLEMNWTGRLNVTVLPLLKSLTFDITSLLIFGIEEGKLREGLKKNFMNMIAGMWAIPVNLPFTNFNASLKASQKVRKVLAEIIKERKMAIEKEECSCDVDLITYLISMRNKDEMEALSDEEIIDNAILVMIAGYDTSSVLVTFMIRQLANDPITRNAVAQEHEEIAKSKAPGEALTWDDLLRMKCTWRVAMETLRMIPPVFGSFRKALKDVEFNGYLIPKGWQVFWAPNVTHMDSNIFKEPDRFDPNRFDNQNFITPYSFVAFGGGTRVCPGNEFAKMETLVMMHYVVTQYDWKLCSKADTYRRDPMPSPSEGLPIQLEPKINMSKTCS